MFVGELRKPMALHCCEVVEGSFILDSTFKVTPRHVNMHRKPT
jgi:hypothetical protein